jgi:cytoskeletal protein CcmA (bactofilin family)
MKDIGLSAATIDEPKVVTTLADDIHIAGTVTFKNALMIKGSIDGEIVSEGLLIVSSGAKVKAKITTKNLVCEGQIIGDVTASEQVVLKKTAVQTGNITTPDIIVESGSVFNGSCTMKSKAVAESPQKEARKEDRKLETGVRKFHDHEPEEEAAPISKEYSGPVAEEAIPAAEDLASTDDELLEYAEALSETTRRMRAGRAQRMPREPKQLS